MRKHLYTTLFLGIVIGLIAFCSFYHLSTAAHRDMLQKSDPELAWIQREFRLSPEEFEKMSKLHAGYQPHCKLMCERIDAQNAQLRNLLAGTNVMTPEIEAAVAESAKLRGECQRDMLAHFLEVSRTMPAEQGRRYLNWIQERTFLPSYDMSQGK